MVVGKVRRSDRAMSDEDSEALLDRALVGRIGTVDAEGTPYVIPVNFAFEGQPRRIHLHLAKEPGHLASNLRFSSRVCFEVDDPGPLIATGETACETSHAYESVVCFGRAHTVTDERERTRVATLFVRKYVDGHMPSRSYKPGLPLLSIVDFVTVEIEVMTGKRRQQTP
jgi:nitroimidazol reductase NimA-like FMN-containing flavoprotein (pyridoxamine 5'-phosphate oxidase superfamily)